MSSSNLPHCHAQGVHPEGYDRRDPLCHNCPDKVSCLVSTEEQGLTDSVVFDDPEVEFVLHTETELIRQLAQEVVTDRQRRRIRLLRKGQAIPEELKVDSPCVLPPAQGRALGNEKEGSLGAPTPNKVFEAPEHMPTPRSLSVSQMKSALSRVRIGQPFELEIGHVLVRHKRINVDVCVELRVDGFWLNLDQKTYGSLSSAAVAAERLLGASPGTKRPGNAYFNLVDSKATEIRDAETGAVLASKRGVHEI